MTEREMVHEHQKCFISESLSAVVVGQNMLRPMNEMITVVSTNHRTVTRSIGL